MSNKIIGGILLLIVVGLVGVYWLGLNDRGLETPVVNSFQECVDAGNPIMESYPEQCRTEDGRTFVNPDQVMPVEPDGGIGDGAGPPATTTPPPAGNGDEQVFCTMDAFQCPDGSWVGRTGPNCEFICPAQ